MNIRVYRMFIMMCLLSYLISGIGIGLILNKNNKKEYIDYKDNEYYKTNYDVRKYNEIELTNIVYSDENKKEIITNIDKNKLSIEKISEDKETNNIEIFNVISLVDDMNEYLQIYAKNKNNISVKTNFKLSFFDNDNNLVDEIVATDIILPSIEFAINYKINFKNNYNSYKISYNAINLDNNIVSIDYINKYDSFVAKDSKGELNILFKNNTMNKIDSIKYTCVFYKDNVVVGAFITQSNTKLPIKYGEGLKCGLSKFDGFSYDTYKIYLSEAYNMKK